MKNKISMAVLCILIIFFLTAQSCNFGTTSGIAADCVGEGDVVCDDTDAYECGLAAYGTGYYVSRATEYDATDCGAAEEETNEDESEEDKEEVEDNTEDLTAYEEQIAAIQMVYDAAKATYDDVSIADIVVMTEEELSAYSNELVELQATIDEQQGELDDLESALNTEDQTNGDVATLESMVNSLQESFNNLEINVSDLIKIVEQLTTTTSACADENDCAGYQCNAGYCENSCEEDSDCATGYECDRMTSAIGVCGAVETLAAACSVSATTGTISDTFLFDGTSSSGAYTFSWDFDGDGTEDSDSVTDSYVYSIDGSYTAILTIADNAGATDTCTVDVVISSPTCSDTDGGSDFETQGETAGTHDISGEKDTWFDYCVTSTGKLAEFYCTEDDTVFQSYVNCETQVGSGYYCDEGVCKK